ncbi:hypothetical protein OsJ_00333 [Oryza sativa Japonica Group]|uniref:DUF4220 domain-containing protein n=1 Tax=Oryza sativa subsp. japonica TaxID=39947 RepID=A2ZP53_ORYSJ|nr:hypothetical protein OsJ_00333 [Oryza sativa Japonica Group]
MQSSSIQNELFVVWACFLLLLLGSADTMTAFSFNDSSQQTRSMMNQTLHVVYLLFLILYYKGQLRGTFLVSLFLLWENQVVYEYMKYEPLNSAGIQGGSSEYIYLVDGEEVEKVDNGEVIKVSYKVPETVDVEKCPQVRLRFAADHVGHINFPLQYDKCRDFVVKGLLANDEDLGRAFRVIEAELGFLFDFFYARYPSIKDTLAPDLAVYIVILATSLFTLFSPDLLRYRYWKGTIGQYFILDNIQPHWVKTFLSWFSLEAQALDSSLMTRSVRLMPVVLRELNNCDGKITDGRMWMYRTGIIDLNLDRDVLHAWTPLLVAFQPELVPDSTYTSTSMARGTLQNACDFLAKCESASDKYDKLMDLGRLDHTEHNVRFLSEGARIAVYLVERIEDAGKRWKVLAAFWANMMLYIAPSDRAVAHATRMATGGEFVTIIWALLSHAHVVDKLQHRGGAPGLPILLEEEEDKRAQAGPALI